MKQDPSPYLRRNVRVDLNKTVRGSLPVAFALAEAAADGHSDCNCCVHSNRSGNYPSLVEGRVCGEICLKKLRADRTRVVFVKEEP